MSKFNEILNSSDASDALLGEQIDKFGMWIKNVITRTESSTFATYFDASKSEVVEYYNPGLRRICIYYSLVTKADVPSSAASIPIGTISNNDYIPKGNVQLDVGKYSGKTYGYIVSKNAVNDILALTMSDGTIPNGTTLTGQYEWQLLP